MMYHSSISFYLDLCCTPLSLLPRNIAYIFINTCGFSKGEQIEQKIGGMVLAS